MGVTQEAAEVRKRRSEAALHALGARPLLTLPLIEAEHEVSLRTPPEVARRVLCLAAVSAVAMGVDKKQVTEWLSEEGLWSAVTAQERRFLLDDSPSKQRVTEYCWRSEAAWMLLWALCLVDDPGPPTGERDLDEILRDVPSGEPTAEFVGRQRLRPVAEILDMSDFLYRAHWACRSRPNQEQYCGALLWDVVYERHRAINWLTCYADAEDWDDVPTDT